MSQITFFLSLSAAFSSWAADRKNIYCLSEEGLENLIFFVKEKVKKKIRRGVKLQG